MNENNQGSTQETVVNRVERLIERAERVAELSGRLFRLAVEAPQVKVVDSSANEPEPPANRPPLFDKLDGVDSKLKGAIYELERVGEAIGIDTSEEMPF